MLYSLMKKLKNRNYLLLLLTCQLGMDRELVSGLGQGDKEQNFARIKVPNPNCNR